MPIANCVISDACEFSDQSIVDTWSHHAGVSPEHMTVNFIRPCKQAGNLYAVMASLMLPSMWDESSINALQTGLATALSEYFEISIGDVHIVTQIIDSGMVVENGDLSIW